MHTNLCVNVKRLKQLYFFFIICSFSTVLQVLREIFSYKELEHILELFYSLQIGKDGQSWGLHQWLSIGIFKSKWRDFQFISYWNTSIFIW